MNGGAATGDARVKDFLDDRLQTSADLESLDTLLDNIKSQQALLRQQVGHDPCPRRPNTHENRSYKMLKKSKHPLSRNHRSLPRLCTIRRPHLANSKPKFNGPFSNSQRQLRMRMHYSNSIPLEKASTKSRLQKLTSNWAEKLKL